MQASRQNSTPAVARRNRNRRSTTAPAIIRPVPEAEREGRRLIQDPAMRARCKEACDVSRAAAVLLDYAARHPAEIQLPEVAQCVALPLAALHRSLDAGDRYIHEDVQPLAEMINGAEQMLQAQLEGIADKSAPPLVLAIAAALRQAADRLELARVGTPGTLATTAQHNQLLAARLEQAAADLRATAQAASSAA